MNWNILRFFRRNKELPIIPKPLDKEYNKIFGIGYPKTGTTSLAVALRGLGFNTFHDASLIFPKVFIDGDFSICKNQDWDAYCNRYQTYFINMDEQYPNSKFILTTRNPGQWHMSLSKSIGDIKPNFLNKYDLNTFSELMKTSDNSPEHFEDVLDCIATFGFLSLHHKRQIRRFNEHNDKVQEYFKDKKDQLLVLPLESNGKYQQICDFLGQPLPNMKYPHEKFVSKRYIS